MLIKEIKIDNILGCRSVHLCFKSNANPIYVVKSEPLSPLRQALVTAVQLICSARYATVQSLTSLNDIHQGSVELMLLIPKRRVSYPESASNESAESDDDDDMPCTSQQAREREARRQTRKQLRNVTNIELPYEVNVSRDFRINPEQLKVTIDGGPINEVSLSDFHGTFCTNVDYILPQLEMLGETFDGKLMDIFATNLYKDCNHDFESPFGLFLDLYLKKNYNNQHFLSKFTESCVVGNTAVNVIQKSHALKILKDARGIFEFVTYNKYTVWFFIPCLGIYVDVNEISLDELDFNNMRTCIQLQCKNKRRYLWSSVEDAIQDMMLISFQLSFAFHCKQSVVYLQKLDAIKDYQAVELSTAAFLQHNNADANWCSHNYLQRIVDVCLKIGVTAIIEYPGGFPMSLENANVIKCFKDETTDSWDMKIEENTTCVLDEFIDCVEQNLQTY